MATQWLRRAFLLAVCVSSALLAACGSGSIESQLVPTRIVAFGDGFADVGQVNNARYTINDGSLNNWTLRVASSFGQSLAPVSQGGLSYATGNARVIPGVKEQVDRAGAFGESDLVLISAGITDVVAEGALVIAGTQTSEQALANVALAGRELGAQVRRLVDAGARHVVVVGTYNLGRSPWALQTGQGAFLTQASTRFNEELLVSIVDLGRSVLYVDAALYLNLITGSPGGYGFTNVTDPVCTIRDPGAGIGTGFGEVNSALCDPSTLLPGVDPAAFLFADRIYPTPHGHALFGDYAYGRIRERW